MGETRLQQRIRAGGGGEGRQRRRLARRRGDDARSGQPVRGLKVDAKLERPATEAGSVVVAFVETAPGVYDVRPTGLTGAWDISASAVDSRGRLFEAERRVIWP